MKNIYHCYYKSPIGTLILVINNYKLVNIYFGKKNIIGGSYNVNLFTNVIMQLEQYFQGKLQKFNLPLFLNGTKFQQQVWNALLQIPYGSTWSYKQVAVYLGQENLARAIGHANSKNPIPIIVPCHRVINNNGTLGGFSSGLAIKRRLLQLEGITI